MAYIAFILFGLTGYLLFFLQRARYLTMRENLSCLELMRKILNVRSSPERSGVESINRILKDYFKADASTIINIESGISVKAATGPVDGIEAVDGYKEVREALQSKEIRLVGKSDRSLYEAAAKRDIEAMVIIPLGGNNANHLWLLEYRSAKKQINFTHLYMLAESLVMPLDGV